MDNKWKGFKDFIVFKKIQEDEVVTSFYLKPLDEKTLPKHVPGQFIAVRIKKGEGEYSKVRQYTLSMDSKEDFYRISVKIEEHGDVSRQLCNDINEGDKIQCTIPMGKFVLKESKDPLVLIGGGIGITPMLSMAYKAVKEDRSIKLIYSLANSKNHSFKDEIHRLVNENDNLELTLIYTRPLECDKLYKDFDIKGRITKKWMEDNLPQNGEYYFCGPVEFMRTIYHNLDSMGIEKDKINFEMFAPGVDITKKN